MDLSNDKLIEMFTRMTRIREFDERAGHLTEEAKVVGSVHLLRGRGGVRRRRLRHPER